MRVAISGTFCSGKTSLIRSLSKRLPHYQTFDEPYVLMEDEGYEFSHPPTVEDCERQLERSLEVVRQAPNDALIDFRVGRCNGFALGQRSRRGHRKSV